MATVYATILEKCPWVNNPAFEVVSLECSDGEAYKCEKFRTVQAVFPGSNKSSAADVAVGARWTAGEQDIFIDIKGTGTTDVAITLIIRGES